MSLSNRFEIIDALMTVLDEDHAVAVMEHRRITIKKPLTSFGAKLLAKSLAKWGDANDAAEIMIERAWQGFDPSWVKDRRAPMPIQEASERFRKLFAAYPIRDTENWTAALEAFNAVEASGEDMDFVQVAAQWLKGSQPTETAAYKESIRFLPTLATWLSERRYESKRDMYNRHLRSANA